MTASGRNGKGSGVDGGEVTQRREECDHQGGVTLWPMLTDTYKANERIQTVEASCCQASTSAASWSEGRQRHRNATLSRISFIEARRQTPEEENRLDRARLGGGRKREE